MSLPGPGDHRGWVPTHVQVTVLRARGLRAKGKHGTSDVYTVIQLGREKFSTAVAEKSAAPEWNEECSFELLPGVLEAAGRGAGPPGSGGELLLTVMHRALVGLDVFLGQVLIPLDKLFQNGVLPKNEWYKLHSKSGRREKERGELQVTIQFTRNSLTASMCDLSVKEKPRSTLGKLKDRVKGKKRGDAESSSAIEPGGYAALPSSGRFSDEGGGNEDLDDEVEGTARRSKVKSFFLKGKLQKTLDTRSSTSLASDGSAPSSPGGSLSPSAGISMVVSDLSNSPGSSTNLTADSSPAVLTVKPSPVPMTHKRAFSDEASKVVAFLPWPRAVENLKAQSNSLSRSLLCINGSHVYTGEPAVPRSVSVLQNRLGLLDKCSPLSRSLQNLTRRSEDHAKAAGGGRRWSFDRSGKEEKTALAATVSQEEARSEEHALETSVVPAAKDEVKKSKKNLLSQGRSEFAGEGVNTAKSQQIDEARTWCWLGAKDYQKKPRLEVSPKVQTGSDSPSHLSPCSPDQFSPCPSPASALTADAPGSPCQTNPFTISAATPPLSPSNPFFTRLQCNPFFDELIADQMLKLSPCHSSSTPWHSVASQTCPSTASLFLKSTLKESIVSKTKRPLGVVRQTSLPELQPVAPGSALNRSPSILSTHSMFESCAEWDDSFEAFATSRLKMPKGPETQQFSKVIPCNRTNVLPQDRPAGTIAEETVGGKAPPLPPRRPSKVPVKELQQDSQLDWSQELAVKKDKCLVFQSDAASLQHQKGEDRQRTGTRLFQESSSETKPIPAEHMNSCAFVRSPSPPFLFKSQTQTAPIPHCRCSPETTDSKTGSRNGNLPEEKYSAVTLKSNEDVNIISPLNGSTVNEEQPAKHIADYSALAAGEDEAEKRTSIFDLPYIFPKPQANNLNCLLAEAPVAKLDTTKNMRTHSISEVTLNCPDAVSVNSRIAAVHPVVNMRIDSVCPATQDLTKRIESVELESITLRKLPTAVTTRNEVNNNRDVINLPSIKILSDRSSYSFAEDSLSVGLNLTSNNYRNVAKSPVASGSSVSTTTLELNNNSSFLELLPPRGQDKNIASSTIDQYQPTCSPFKASEEQPASPRMLGSMFSTQPSSGSEIQQSDDPSSNINLEDLALLHTHPDNIDQRQSNRAASCEFSGNDLKETNTLTSGNLEVNQPSPLKSNLCRFSLREADENVFSASESDAQPTQPLGKKNRNRATSFDADNKSSLIDLSSCIIMSSRAETQVLMAPFTECAQRNQEQSNPPSIPPNLSGEVLQGTHHVDKSLVVEFEGTVQAKNLYDEVSSSCPLVLCSGLEQGHIYKNCVSSKSADLPLGKEDQNEAVVCTKELNKSLGETNLKSQEVTEQHVEGKSPTLSICSNPLTVTVNVKSNLSSTLIKYDQQEDALLELSLSENTRQMTFEDIHASVAPSCRNYYKSGQTSELCNSSQAPSASSPTARTNSQSALSPSPNLPLLTVRPSTGTTQATAPSSTVQPLIGAAHPVLPEETQLASSFLSHRESSPHPVKPLTTTAIQSDKKAESHSILVSGLERLKSSIHPGRTASHGKAEADKSKPNTLFQYQHLSRSELIALLQQKEVELEKQKVEFEKQELKLEKQEVEFKKLKMQVRDLEDYIDRLLVRIMEQTPTLLQVRSRSSTEVLPVGGAGFGKQDLEMWMALVLRPHASKKKLTLSIWMAIEDKDWEQLGND
ncbi:hypothetical protein GN956_G1616 [Arapaima gigas]